jgi:hypothetical protein
MRKCTIALLLGVALIAPAVAKDSSGTAQTIPDERTPEGGQPMVEIPLPPACADPAFGLTSKGLAIGRYDAIDPRELLERGAPDDQFLVMRLAEDTHDIATVEVWRPAKPIFRAELQAGGFESACAAMFDVATDGRAANIAIACDVPGFERDVRNAVAESLYVPMRKDGTLIPTKRVLLPVRFCLAE